MSQLVETLFTALGTELHAVNAVQSLTLRGERDRQTPPSKSTTLSALVLLSVRYSGDVFKINRGRPYECRI